ncbi:MAG: hypothetical protein NT025_07165 [bacterium]|nr:hypothetical protein [bacterium]
MKHTSFYFRGLWAVLAAIGLLTLTASARTVTPRHDRAGHRLDNADPLAVKSLIAHDIGNVRMTLSNWGEGGNPDGVVGYKGFEFPINSGNDFLFSSGMWVGAIVNGVMQVSTTTDGDNGTNEFYPVHIGAVPSSRVASSADWFVTSKNFATFADFDYVQGAKGADDDGDWTAADHRVNPNYDDGRPTGRPSDNYDGGKGLIGYDDDGDGLIDEEITNGLDDDLDGKIDEDTDASGDTNGDGNCSYDPERHIDEDPAGDISHDYVDNDFDGLVDMDDPDYDGDLVVGSDDDDGDGLIDEDGVARGVQEYYCVYQDDIEARYVGSPNDPHTPLKLEILQRSYAFPEAYAADFILIDYRIRSRNPLPLENVFVALFADPDVAAAGEGGDAASADDYNFYDAANVMMIQGDDSTDADGFGPGYFAMRVVKTPAPLSELRVNFHNFGRISGGDPEFDPAKYVMIESNAINPPSEALDDVRMLLGFGPDATSGFRLNPGQELPITVAYIAGGDLATTRRNAEWALRMFLNDFQGPSAPSTPEFALDVYADMVRIRWLPNSESSVDVISQRADFEGYIIERSTDQIRWQTIASYDRIDRLDTLHTYPYPDFPDSLVVVVDPSRREFEWQNYNLGMPQDCTWVGEGADRHFEYYREDRDLIPGHTYYYAVRAFDKGEVGAGILYSGRTGNVQTALIARRADTGAPNDLSGVYVFPNPYKGSHAGEEGGQVNPTKGLLEYPRKLYFMGLPPATRAGECVIRIFSLGGDHLASLQHTNGTEYDQWDMITQNRQEIVSGIYYYTVEYGSKQFIDKFVVIK